MVGDKPSFACGLALDVLNESLGNGDGSRKSGTPDEQEGGAI